MRIQDLKSKIEKNIKFLNAFELDYLINYLKEVAIDVLDFPKDDVVEAIRNITDITVSKNKYGISRIEMHTSTIPYNDVFIELNTSHITVSRQDGHSDAKPIARIPVSVIAMACELEV